jgi:hypothetical protein
MPYHRLVVEEGTGERIGKGLIVHHKDGKKRNNVFDNLQIMTRAAHRKLHKELKAKRRLMKRITKVNKMIARKNGIHRRVK